MTNSVTTVHGLSVQQRFDAARSTAHLCLDMQVDEAALIGPARQHFRCWLTQDRTCWYVNNHHWLMRLVRRQVRQELRRD